MAQRPTPRFDISQIIAQAKAQSPTFATFFTWSQSPTQPNGPWPYVFGPWGTGSRTNYPEHKIIIDPSITPDQAFVEVIFETVNAVGMEQTARILQDLRAGKFATGEAFARAMLDNETSTVVTTCKATLESGHVYSPDIQRIVAKYTVKASSGGLDFVSGGAIKATNEAFPLIWQTAKATDSETGATGFARDIYKAQWQRAHDRFHPPPPAPAPVHSDTVPLWRRVWPLRNPSQQSPMMGVFAAHRDQLIAHENAMEAAHRAMMESVRQAQQSAWMAQQHAMLATRQAQLAAHQGVIAAARQATVSTGVQSEAEAAARRSSEILVNQSAQHAQELIQRAQQAQESARLAQQAQRAAQQAHDATTRSMPGGRPPWWPVIRPDYETRPLPQLDQEALRQTQESARRAQEAAQRAQEAARQAQLASNWRPRIPTT